MFVDEIPFHLYHEIDYADAGADGADDRHGDGAVGYGYGGAAHGVGY